MPPEPAIRNPPQQGQFVAPIANPMTEEVKALEDQVRVLNSGHLSLEDQQAQLQLILDGMQTVIEFLEQEVTKRVRGIRLGEFAYSWSGIVLAVGPRKQSISVPGAVAGEPVWAFPVSVPDGFLISHAQATAKDTVQLTVYGPALAIGGAAQSIRVLLIALR